MSGPGKALRGVVDEARAEAGRRAPVTLGPSNHLYQTRLRHRLLHQGTRASTSASLQQRYGSKQAIASCQVHRRAAPRWAVPPRKFRNPRPSDFLLASALDVPTSAGVSAAGQQPVRGLRHPGACAAIVAGIGHSTPRRLLLTRREAEGSHDGSCSASAGGIAGTRDFWIHRENSIRTGPEASIPARAGAVENIGGPDRPQGLRHEQAGRP